MLNALPVNVRGDECVCLWMREGERERQKTKSNSDCIGPIGSNSAIREYVCNWFLSHS